MKIVSIVGARPQFVKAAVVSRAIRAMGVEEILVHTGQHYDDNMSQIFFRELEIAPPDYDLGIGSGSHGAQTGRMLHAIEEKLLYLEPDWVLIFGDTNSTLAGAVAASKLQMKTAHVEAGLRSFNRRMPEEVNRVVADHLSDLLFCPTESAVKNLVKEGVEEQKIKLVGDVMYDAALFYAEKAETQSTSLKTLNLTPKKFILATIHRAENTDDIKRLKVIFESLAEISRELTIVLPLHPRTEKVVRESRELTQLASSLTVIPPVGYLDMVNLEKNAALIVTDSGGVQKEAFFHQVPCVTIRDQTEWVELIDLGWNRLVRPTETEQIVRALRRAIGSRGRMGEPYGDGKTGHKIAHLLVEC